MERKAVSGIMLTLLLMGMLTLAYNIQPANSETTTIIVPDDYSTIQGAVNAANSGDIVYVRAGTYYEKVLVKEKSISLIGEDKTTTILDGGNGTTITVAADNVHIDGFTIRNGLNGILLSQSRNSTISGNILTLNIEGIQLVNSTGISVFDNIMTECGAVYPAGGLILGGGIAFLDSHNSTIYGNIITNNIHGLQFDGSTYNLIYRNTIANNEYGIISIDSNNNRIHHNNFINNTDQVISYNSGNMWNNSYPSGGNYWSNYTGLDLYSGPQQNETGIDGIGDTSYFIDEDNQDHYPLMEPWSAKPSNPVEATQDLIETIETWNLSKGLENSLTSKLDNVIHLLDKGNEKGATHKLIALINQVGALREKKLTTEQANYLIAEAQRIRNLISG